MDDVTRRSVLDRAAKYALSGLAAAGTVEDLVPKQAWAQQAAGFHAANTSSRRPELAKCPNVVTKVGGSQMVVNGYGWHERKRPPTSDELLDANAQWYRYTIGQFGPRRCMFESHFPVDRLSCSYTVLWNQSRS